MTALLALLVAAAPSLVAVLPVDAPELPRESARAAAEALGAALPAPFHPTDLDARAVREHLAAAGPACRAEPSCLCVAAGLSAGQLALDLTLVPAGPGAWGADLRVLAPCDGSMLDRRAEIVPAGIAGLQRFLEEAVPALLRGRDLLRLPAIEAPATPSPAPAGAAAPAAGASGSPSHLGHGMAPSRGSP